jgi:hypothetical protein
MGMALHNSLAYSHHPTFPSPSRTSHPNSGTTARTARDIDRPESAKLARLLSNGLTGRESLERVKFGRLDHEYIVMFPLRRLPLRRPYLRYTHERLPLQGKIISRHEQVNVLFRGTGTKRSRFFCAGVLRFDPENGVALFHYFITQDHQACILFFDSSVWADCRHYTGTYYIYHPGIETVVTAADN